MIDQPPQWFVDLFTTQDRDRTIEKHRRDKAAWPWYGKLQHWLFCSWRCPACKALRKKGA